ncbi:MAG TPA: hypothetical protein VNP98_02170 [Chthoniobacterales bacterium]|nr:hypothetical protein [Chthoniobacterales bacterium]
MAMRFTLLASLAALLAGCAAPGNAPENRSVTTYYDRNKDGVADYELHQVPGTAYWTWALVDTKFTGRYDVRMKLAYPFDSERVNLPVSRNVKVKPGMPPYQAPRVDLFSPSTP